MRYARISATMPQVHCFLLTATVYLLNLFVALLNNNPFTNAACHSPISLASPPQTEINALIDFYDALTQNGPWVSQCGWDTIVNGSLSNPCTWYGITCGQKYNVGLKEYSSVTTINFPSSNNMVGMLPDSISAFSYLEKFVIESNAISGSLPASISNWTALESFELSGVSVVGTLPSGIGSWKNLNTFTLENTGIYGELPQSAYNWTKLISFIVENSGLSGSVPDAPAYWKQLQTFTLLSTNHFGPVPIGFEKLANLTTLVIFCCRKVTTIPQNILCSTSLRSVEFAVTEQSAESYGLLEACSGMRNLPMINLQIENLPATGTIASDFGLIYPNIVNIWTWNTLLSGPLPESICSTWTRFPIMIYFSQNLYSGTVPKCYLDGTLKLSRLFLDSNSLTGPLPHINSTLVPILNQLLLSDNHFSGTVPSNIGLFSRLIYLCLDSNSFSGYLPSKFNMPNLILFSVNQNRFTGPIPMINSANLAQYIAFDNYFSSSIPAMIAPIVSTILLGNNLLTGSLPNFNNSQFRRNATISNFFAELSTFDISFNKITGPLPENMFRYASQLLSFSAGLNCMSTSIPDSICAATNLMSLSLSGLSERCQGSILTSIERKNGHLPSCTWRLPNLQNLSFVGNAMTGSIPADVASSLTLIEGDNNLIQGDIYDLLSYHTSYSYPKTIQMSNNLIKNRRDISDIPEKTLQVIHYADFTNNRLSGSLYDISKLNQSAYFSVLSGNIFSCTTKELLGSRDPNTESYECGSTVLNLNRIGFGIYMGFLIIPVAVVIYLAHCRVNKNGPSDISKSAHIMDCLRDDFMAIFGNSPSGTTLNSTDSWIDYLRNIVYLYAYTLFTTLVFNTPIYGAETDRKFETLFSWSSTGIFLSGTSHDAVTYILYFVWTINSIVVLSLLLRINKGESIYPKLIIEGLNYNKNQADREKAATLNPLSSGRSVSDISESADRTSTDSSNADNNNVSATKFCNTTNLQKGIFYLCLWFLTIISVLSFCTAVNYYYVKAKSSDEYSSQMKFVFEVLYAIFKIFLFSFAIKKIFTLFTAASAFLTLTAVSISILLLRAIIPILIFVIFSKSCLHNYFFPIQESYVVNYNYCNSESILGGGECDLKTNSISSSLSYSFSPLYRYTYICSSTTSQIYIPLFMTSQIILIISTSVFYCYAISMYLKSKEINNSLAPSIEVDKESNSKPVVEWFRRNLIHRFVVSPVLNYDCLQSRAEFKDLKEFILDRVFTFKTNLVSSIFMTLSFGQISCVYQLMLFCYQILQFMYLRHILVRGKQLLLNSQRMGVAEASDFDIELNSSLYDMQCSISNAEFLLLVASSYLFFVFLEVDIIESIQVWYLVPYSAIVFILYSSVRIALRWLKQYETNQRLINRSQTQSIEGWEMPPMS